jgi:hypothetical protein
MSDLKWLDRYSGQTTDQLIAMEGTYRIDSLVLAFEQAIDQKAARLGHTKLTEEERAILAIEALEREVNNGGFGQFFVNSSREYAPIIVDSLRRIGCPITAEITEKAVTVMQQIPMSPNEIEDGKWEDNDDRSEVLMCDSLYFESSEDIAGSLFAFVKANRDRISP